jgi:hypothetical protein
VPQNGEQNTTFGVYRNVCCGAEVVINVGSTFPDCPNHRKLTTTWTFVPDEKAQQIHGHKTEVDPAGTHIENRRLFDVASGRIKLSELETNHLHRCSLCQGVLCVFMNQQSMPPEGKAKSEPAA